MLIQEFETMGEALVPTDEVAPVTVTSCSNCNGKTAATAAPTARGRTPTQRSQDPDTEAETAYYTHQSFSHYNHNNHNNNYDYEHERERRLPNMVYVVTDTFYPSASTFDTNLGTTSVISIHGSKAAANERAKKIIYENEGGGAVDIDKIIEEVKNGLYTGIGVGGKGGGCFARKCEVEARMLDEDSEDEGSAGSMGYGGNSDQEYRSQETYFRGGGGGGGGEQQRDVEMG
ncbi:hypothetical protein NX059_005252 [Plenodomus lindquistii]|nr:hypothetical protein NX059_005252 [Plenodomus lindquistii]